MVPRARFGPIPIGRPIISIDEPQYHWMQEHGTLYIPDVRAQKDFPALGSAGDWRTYLTAPLRQQGELIGTLNARRTELRPFTPTQIKLLETFTDQAVIAHRKCAIVPRIKESLEQQTATSEILGVIAARRLTSSQCWTRSRRTLRAYVTRTTPRFGLPKAMCLDWPLTVGRLPFCVTELPIDRDWVTGRAFLDRQLIHIEDVQSIAAAEFPRTRVTTEQEGTRTVLVVPMIREDTPIGTILIRRTEVRPFSNKQIALLKISPTKLSSQLRMCVCSKNSRSATRNCARRWSIKQPPPRSRHHQPLADGCAAGARCNC